MVRNQETTGVGSGNINCDKCFKILLKGRWLNTAEGKNEAKKGFKMGESSSIFADSKNSEEEERNDLSCSSIILIQNQSVQLLSHVRLFATPSTAALQASLSMTNSQIAQTHVHGAGDAIHPTISSSVVPFSFHLQSFPASVSFPMSQFFASGGQF